MGLLWIPWVVRVCARDVIDGAAHLAVWAGVYVATSVVCFAQVSGLSGTKWQGMAFAFCLAAGVYLLDRVKVLDAWLDPADALAHPRRYAFLTSRSGWVRVLIVALLGAATWLGWGLARWGAALPVLAVAGVLMYAARPRGARARPKDVLLVKNLYVAAGITGFAGLTVIGATTGRWAEARSLVESHAMWLGISAGHLLVRVFADAMLCDLDDERSDRDHGTRTVPGVLGRGRAWDVAMGIRLVLAAGLMAMGLFGAERGTRHGEMLEWWAGVTAVSSIVLRVAAPARVRDWVDARLGMEAVVVSLGMMVW